MPGKMAPKWPMGSAPSVSAAIPGRMDALTIRRDQYGPPSRAIHLEEVAVPRLRPEDASRVLVAVLATGANFNTNFASLGLPVPVFGKGDAGTVHVPGSDALGIVVDAGAGVTSVKVGQAVILDSWTGRNIIRGYETHDGFNAQFAVVDEERALAVPDELKCQSPERMAALLLTYGTAYRAVVERLAVAPGDSVLLMGGGKGTSFAGAQIAKALGARVILMGSNAGLGRALIARGIADAFIDRRRVPESAFGVIPADLPADQWRKKTAPFRDIVLAANHGQPVDRIFEHTGGRNFPLLVSVLAENGRLAFFGATGQGMKGEYKESFFYEGRRFVMDARWVWMRQKQILFRNQTAREIFTEIRLPAGRNGLIWGTDGTALDFARAALERQARLAVVASRSRETAGIRDMQALGIADSQIIDRDRFDLPEDMPDPLTEAGRPNPAYGQYYMASARALGKAVWEVFGPKVSPDFIAERTDQSTLHFSTFLLRDFTEQDDMPCGFVVARGPSNLSLLGSHMYRSSQARDVVRLLGRRLLVMEQGDLEVVGLEGLPELQQKMLDGRMGKPKGVALVQADRAGRRIAEFENGYFGEHLIRSDAGKKRHVDFHLAGDVGMLTLCRPEALNALNHDLIRGLGEVISELKTRRGIQGRRVRGLILRGAGRAFVAGADVTEFAGRSARRIEEIALSVLGLFSEIENLKIPVIAVLDGFTLGGGNELAMSAHYRIATENAVIGQPEIKLGIIPGFGGLQRLPRLVGPRKAVEMSVNGEPIGAREALRVGLVDEIAPSGTALRAAFQAARAFIEGRRKPPRQDWDAVSVRQKGQLKTLLKHPTVQEWVSAAGTRAHEALDLAAARRFASGYAIRALEYGYRAGFKKGLKNDATLFGEVAASASGQEWIRRFIDKDPRQSTFLTILPP
jgi:enoyl-CoA hydratase